MRLVVATIVGFLGIALVPVALGEDAPATEGLEFFEAKIRPVLVRNCYTCHSAEAKTRMGGLSLDTRDGIREGGQRGHAVVPGDVESSLVVDALRYDGSLKMPPTGRLSDEVLRDFEKWISMGAPDPRVQDAVETSSMIDLEQGRRFWAFQIPERTRPPAVRDLSWPKGTIDQHVLAGLEREGLRPVQDASKPDLLRRLSVDLTGLPPTPEELDGFLADSGDRAYADAVDRLLESDRFGEHWGRHWLDVVRYADTIGRTRNLPLPVAWRYRDYVIDSFNEDKPYDRFVREQVAGDLLPHSGPAERIRNQVATGFLALGAHDLNEPDPKQFEMDIADEMINVSTRSFLALSVGCARCHDHKFDPVPTADYYALAAIFRSSELRNGLRRRPRFNAGYFRVQGLVQLDGVPDYTTDDATDIRAERTRLQSELEAAERARDAKQCRELSRALGKLPLPENLAVGVVEATRRVKTRINIGGDPHTLGSPVERGFVQVLFPASADLPRIRRRESGRLQLAEWLTRPDNPLTARVMANRVWKHLFGVGLVPSVDNFGFSGRRPTNQPLLDHLAVGFMERGWSVKSLAREIVLSRTYRLSTQFDKANAGIDPDNVRLWRANMRRLEAESLRDSVLQASGELLEGPPPVAPVHLFERNQLLNPGNKQVRPWEREESYRSVYLPVIRNQPIRMLEAFDFPEASETRGSRDITTGPGQALLLLNGAFVRSHASVAAERLMADESDGFERVRAAFRQTLSRDPSPGEAERALRRVRETVERIESEQGAPPDPDAAQWMERLLEAALGNQLGEGRLAVALEYIQTVHPFSGRSPSLLAAALHDGDGKWRRDVARELIERAAGRKPSRQDATAALRRARQFVRREAATSGDMDSQATASLKMVASPEREAWSRLYHALFNSAEFRYRN